MQPKKWNSPRIIIAALRGGSGKTVISVGIVAAWTASGRGIAPFKKGPDYIDAGWLAKAAGRPCYNLDPFLVPSASVKQSFITHTNPGDIAVIEGNRGLFDGLDSAGSTSTAELAKLLAAPVILCLDCTKSTRTMAAIVAGCVGFDTDIRIAGVILNRVAGARHEKIVRESIERYANVPVIGAVPKLGRENFPERHMGLVPTFEHSQTRDSIAAAAEAVRRYIDLEAVERIAGTAPALTPTHYTKSPNGPTRAPKQRKVRIGVIKDSAFQFYYPDNIEALAAEGAEIEYISPLKRKSVPDVDGLYIGGGFPETHAALLADNTEFKDHLRKLADNGLPIYAECGGLMYLGQELILEGKRYPMAGVLPLKFGFSRKPRGHGYTMVTVSKPNPFYEVGTRLKGHEFHYSHVVEWQPGETVLAFSMERGKGLVHHHEGPKDGICYRNVLATYTHIHALGSPAWAKAMVRNALVYGSAVAGG